MGTYEDIWGQMGGVRETCERLARDSRETCERRARGLPHHICVRFDRVEDRLQVLPSALLTPLRRLEVHVGKATAKVSNVLTGT